jgi:hypothetical protein
MTRTPSRLAIALFVVGLFLACGSRAARGQAPSGAVAADPVTATSGDTATIVAIRTLQREIDRSLSGLRKEQRELMHWSLEGGEVVGAFRGDELRKVHARHYGESFRRSEELYFRDGELAFAFIVDEMYAGGHYLQSNGGKVELRVEHRMYFDRGRLVRRIRTQKPAVYEWDESGRDPRVEEVLEDAKAYTACVRAKGEAPAECARPDPEA